MTNAVNNIVRKEKPQPIDNTEIVNAFRAQGGQILHILPRTLRNGKGIRGVTLAFIRKSGRVEISTAIQHRADQFCKKNGTQVAIEHFNAGKNITFPIVAKTNSHLHRELRLVFGQLYGSWEGA